LILQASARCGAEVAYSSNPFYDAIHAGMHFPLFITGKS
jgi:hypothetical protein